MLHRKIKPDRKLKHSLPRPKLRKLQLRPRQLRMRKLRRSQRRPRLRLRESLLKRLQPVRLLR